MLDRSPVDRSRLVALIGWLGVAVFAVSSIVTAIAYIGSAGEAYSPLNHYVSELGERKNSELGVVFNAGLVIGGLCLLVFLVEVGRRIGGRRGWVVSGLGAVAGIAGTQVGIFPMDQHSIHVLVAAIYFLSLAAAVGLATLWMGGSRFPRNRLVTLLALVTVIASAGFYVIFQLEGPGPGGAADPNAPRPSFALDTTVEWIALIGIMAWVTAAGLIVWRSVAETRPVPQQVSGALR